MVFTWDATTSQLVGMAGGTEVMVLTVDQTNGTVSFQLKAPVDHPYADDPYSQGTETAFEDEIAIDFGFTAKDSDGDTVEHAITIRIDDDSPTLEAVTQASVTITLDESVGKDATDPQTAPDADEPAETGAIGTRTGSVTNLFQNIQFGADGPGAATVYKLVLKDFGGAGTSIGTTNVPTNLSVTDPNNLYASDNIVLVSVSDFQVNAYVGSYDPESSSNVLAFLVRVDGATGELTVSQFLPLAHDTDGSSAADHDDILDLVVARDGGIYVSATVSDYDGDKTTVEAPAPLGISFEDDGPKVLSVTDFHDSNVTGPFLIDEDNIGNGNQDGPGDDAGGGATLYKVNVDFGSDNAAAQAFAFTGASVTANGAPLADLKTADGQSVTIGILASGVSGLPAGSIVGFTGGDINNWQNWVFTATLDAQFGGGQFSLLKPLYHPLNDDPASKDAVETAFEDNIVLTFGVRVTDGDGDYADTTIAIDIDDDSPVAHADNGGNVVETTKVDLGTVADFLLANDKAGADGLKDSVIIGNGGTGSLGGTLEIINGHVWYTAPNVQDDAKETFSYTITDKDGDQSTADVSFNVTDRGGGDGSVTLKVTSLGGFEDDESAPADQTIADPVDQQLTLPFNLKITVIDAGDTADFIVIGGVPSGAVVSYNGTDLPAADGSGNITINRGEGHDDFLDALTSPTGADIGVTLAEHDDRDFTLTLNGEVDDVAIGAGSKEAIVDAVAAQPAFTLDPADQSKEEPGAPTASQFIVTTAIAFADFADGSETQYILIKNPGDGWSITGVESNGTALTSLGTLPGYAGYTAYAASDLADSGNGAVPLTVTVQGPANVDSDTTEQLEIKALAIDSESDTESTTVNNKAEATQTIDLKLTDRTGGTDDVSFVGQGLGGYEDGEATSQGQTDVDEPADQQLALTFNFKATATDPGDQVDQVSIGGIPTGASAVWTDGTHTLTFGPGSTVVTPTSGGTGTDAARAAFLADLIDGDGADLVLTLAEHDSRDVTLTMQSTIGGTATSGDQASAIVDAVAAQPTFVGTAPADKSLAETGGANTSFTIETNVAFADTEDGNEKQYVLVKIPGDGWSIPLVIGNGLTTFYDVDAPTGIQFDGAVIGYPGHIAIDVTDIAGPSSFNVVVFVNGPADVLPAGSSKTIEIKTVAIDAVEGQDITPDNNVAEAVQSVTLTVTDTAPTVNQVQATIRVDEDGLAGGNTGAGDDAIGDDTTTDSASFSGNLSYSKAVDSITGIQLWTETGGAGGTGLETLAGDPIKTVWDAASKTLTGFADLDDNGEMDGGESAVFTLTVTDLATGAYTFTLLQPVKHAGSDPAFEDDKTLDIKIQVTDDDGSTSNIGTVSVNIDDDTATARNDTDSVGNLASTEGNVITGLNTTSGDTGKDSLGADGAQVSRLDGHAGSFDADGSNGFSVTGQYGTLTMDTAGNYTYTRFGSNPLEATDTFTYTLKDGDGDVVTATLTIDINDKGTSLDVPPAGGDKTTVYEAGLPARGLESEGSNAAAASEQVSGSFAFTAPDGLGSIKIGDQTFNLAQLQDLNVTAVTITGGSQPGTLVLNGFDAGKNEISYTYTLNDNTSGDNTKDSFAIEVIDSDGDKSNGALEISIVDDAPDAKNDTDSLQEGAGNQATGNVITGAGTTNPVAGKDVEGADSALVTALVGFGGSQDANGGDGFSVNGQYGTLTMNPDGSYIYTLTAALVPADASETFTYTLTDGDTDSDTATLVITIDQDTRIPSVANSQVLVDEEGLPSRAGSPSEPAGTDAAGNSETDTGSFLINTNGEVMTALVIGGVPVNLAAPFPQTLVDNAQGKLVIDGVTSGVGGYTVAYTYTLKDNAAHLPTVQGKDDQVDGPVFSVAATDATGDTGFGQIKVVISDDAPKVEVTLNNESVLSLVTKDANTEGPASDSATSVILLGNLFSTWTADGADGLGAPASFACQLAITATPVGGLVDSGLTSNGAAIYLYDIGGTIVGSTALSAPATVDAPSVVFSIALNPASGNAPKLVLTQHQEVDHDTPGVNSNFDSQIEWLPNNLVSLTGTLSVIDSDGDTASDSKTLDLGGNVGFADDGPNAEALGYAIPFATLDESDGSGSGKDGVNPGTISAGTVAALFATPDFGVDGPAAGGGVSYKLSATDGAATSLWLTGKGTFADMIRLVKVSDTLFEGREGGAGGTLAFSISINPATGEITVTQHETLEHGDDGSLASGKHDDFLQLGTSIYVVQRVEDGDGDFDEAVSNQPLLIEFHDDGPDATVKDATGSLVLDESDGTGSGNDGKASGTIAGADLFNAPQFGADGPAATNQVSYKLSATDGASTGLWLTGQSDAASEIKLVKISDTLFEGHVGGIDNDDPAFTISIDPATGIVTVTQLKALEHTQDGAAIEGKHDDAVSLGAAIHVVQRIEDGDGDFDEATSQNALAISFQDDGPLAVDDDFGSVTHNLSPVYLGNILTQGTDDGFGADGPGTPQITDIGWSGWTTSGDGITGWTMTSGAGTISVAPNGDVTYTGIPGFFNNTVNFVYTIKDKDGDVDYGQASFYVAGDPADGTTSGSVTVDEDSKPNQWDNNLGNDTPVAKAVNIVFNQVGDTDEVPQTVTIKDLPAGAVLSYTKDSDASNASFTGDGATDLTISWAEAQTLKLTQPQNDSGNDYTIDYTVHAKDSSSGETADIPGQITVEVNAVADLPTALSGSFAGKGAPGLNVNLTVNGSFDDVTDGSERHFLLVKLPGGDWDGGSDLYTAEALGAGNPYGVLPGTYIVVEVTGQLGAGDHDASAVVSVAVPAAFAGSSMSFPVFAVAIDNEPLFDPIGPGEIDGDNLAVRESVVDLDVAQKPSFTVNTVKLDEDGLANANGNQPGNGDDDQDAGDSGDGLDDPLGPRGTESIWQQSISVDWNGDVGALAIGFAQQSGGFIQDGSGNFVRTAEGDRITWSATNNAGTTEIVAYKEGGNSNDPVFTITLTPNGVLTVELLKPLQHESGNLENNLGFPLWITATNIAGESMQFASVDVDDDMPVLTLNPDATAGIIVDESNLGLDGKGNFSGLFTPSFGADGGGSVGNYTLGVKEQGVASGLTDTATGQPVFLFLVGGQVIAKAGADKDAAEAGSTVVFVLSVNANSGEVTLDQQRAVVHPDAANPDDIKPLAAADLVTLTATVVDKDGDTVPATADIGDRLLFKDDGPAANDDGVLNITTLGVPVAGTNLLTNDAAGADGGKTLVGIRLGGEAGVYTPVGVGGTDIQVKADGSEGTPAIGTLHVNPDGSWTFTQTVGSELANLTFSYQMKDADGDTDTASFAVNLDSVPTITVTNLTPQTQGGEALVDEDWISGGNLDIPASTGDDAGFNTAQGLWSTSNGDPTVTVTVDGIDSGTTQTGATTFDGTPILWFSSGSSLPATLEGRTTAGGDVYFTLTINSNGTWSFTLLKPVKHGGIDSEDPNVLLNAVTLKATDADGDEATAQIRIAIDDDMPVANDDGLLTTVDDNAAGVTIGTVAGILGNDKFGADGADSGDIVIGAGDKGGSVVIIGGNLVYTSATNVTPGATVTETFTYTIKDADGDTETATFSVNLTDTKATFSLAPANASVDEEGLGGGNAGDSYLDGKDLAGQAVSVSGQALNINYGTDTPGTVTFDAGQPGLAGIATSNGTPVNFVVLNGGTLLIGYTGGVVPTGTGDAQVVFHAALNAAGTGSYDFTLKQALSHPTANTEDDKTLTFAITAKDAEGEGSSATFTVTVDDDAPLANADTRTMDEQSTITGNVYGVAGAGTGDVADAIGADGPNAGGAVISGKSVNLAGGTVSVDADGEVITGQYGNLTLKSDGTYSYQAGSISGGDKQDVFEYTIKDADGDTKTTTLTINVNDQINFVPDAVDDVNDTSSTPLDYQLMLILDFSGSMDEIVSTPEGDKTRLQIARDSLISLLEQYKNSTSGTVSVKLIGFAEYTPFSAQYLAGSNSAFATVDAAIAALQAVTPFQGSGNTDYDDALWLAKQGIDDPSWQNSVTGSLESKVYFVSDGRPTSSDSTSPFGGTGDGSNQVNDGEETIWQNSLQAKGVQAIAVGVGADIAGDASALAQLGQVAYTPGGGADTPVITVTDENQLTAALGSTAPAPINGFLLANDIVNPADPLASPKIFNLTMVDDADTDFVSQTFDANTWTIVTNNGTLVVDRTDGSYDYTPKAGSEGKSDSFVYTIKDTNGGDQDSATLTINIKAAPVITSDGGGATAAINVVEGTKAVTDVNASDADTAQSGLSYSIIGGADAALFDIDSVTGQLSFKNAPDYENPQDAGADNNYNVTVKVTDGGQSDTQAITVTVTDKNDVAPVLSIGGSTILITEDFSSGNYSGGSGWKGSWTENDNNNATTGDVYIAKDGGNNALFLYDTDDGADSVQRSADLSGATSATISFDYRNVMSAGGETVRVQISKDGVTFDDLLVLDENNDDAPYATFTKDISAYISGNTTIRVIADSELESNDQAWIDNIQISAGAPATNHATTFTEGGGPVAIASVLSSVTDADSANMASASIVLTNAKANDVLAVGALPAGITSNINTSVPGQITVTLTGPASKAAFEQAIEAVTFNNTSLTPDTTPRNITVTVNDGVANSNTATTTITVVDVVTPPPPLPDGVEVPGSLPTQNAVPVATPPSTDSKITVSGDTTGNGNNNWYYDNDDGKDAAILNGAGGNDRLEGNAGDDTLIGGSGNDYLDGGSGNDDMSGGTGNDTYLVGQSGDDILENSGEGTDIVFLSNNSNYTLAANVENLVQTGNGSITLTGNAQNNEIYGGVGNNTINGGDGNDYIDGGSGTDTLNGEAGNDVLFGNVSDDTLNGGADNDILFGQAGDDTLNGGDGNDVLVGGIGNDKMDGGAGNDVFVGVEGVDLVNASIEGGTGTDLVDLSGLAVFNSAAAANIKNVEILSFEGGVNTNISLSYDDVIGMTDSDHVLAIRGDASDNFDTTGWTSVASGVAGDGGRTYTVFQQNGADGVATVYVESVI
ncbi:DUF5801 repeats-in-toxin domain-containing protein [Dongia mobilis]|uniref:DUF5801 repeats-in-toxin domain-containing protein n=1 Tax=Dongia mobilis TaxID=578943 RepID=UPI001AADA1D0|nr:DUF5801 repeats-in-toxin domain-containing protein [Dongia mobilis]